MVIDNPVGVATALLNTDIVPKLAIANCPAGNAVEASFIDTDPTARLPD